MMLARSAGIACFLVLSAFGVAEADEKLDRGLVGLRRSDGPVYLGWRLLALDPGDVAFHVYRRAAGGGAAQRLTPAPIGESTNFVDDSAPRSGDAAYFVRAVIDGKEGPPSAAATLADTPAGASFIRIRLQGDYAAQKAAVADLDGDGRYDYVIKQPDANIDPWHKYWEKSPDTYKLEAYGHDGKFLWGYDLGWAIERGIWYSPYIVYDLDGDGRAEVYAKAGEGDPRDPDGKVTSGPEWLVQIDGLTGKVKRKAPWPDRSGYQSYNWTSRNLIGVAYLDGQRPYLIVVRGTYAQIKVEARDAQLDLVWRWNSRDEQQRYNGSGFHGLHAADVDGDGRDEIVLGSAVLDDTGRGLWTNPMHHELMAHPDVCSVGDIDPNHPGLEIFYGFETGQPRDGVCLMDARTGAILWSFDGPTRHVHAQGMVGDIIARYPGRECYAGEQDGSQYWLYTAGGKRIGTEPIGNLSPRPVFWDADPQKELLIRYGERDSYKGRILDYKGKTHHHVESRAATIADCLGDWREEIITSPPGELRIYTTTIPAHTRRVCLMQDHLYRLDVAMVSMGYFHPPQHSSQ